MNSCEEISDKLVDYVDGELSQREMNEIAEHVAGCPRCREMCAALKESLELVEKLWEDSEKEATSSALQQGRKHPWGQKILRVAVAAGLVLLLGGAVIWQILTPVDRKTTHAKQDVRPAEVAMLVKQAKIGAQMLAAANLVCEQPGGERYAEKRYTYLAKAYFGGEVGRQATLRLRSLSEKEY